MEAVLRGAALLAGTQYSLKMLEEKHGAYTLVGYRFSEDQPLKTDVGDFRFNFSPCFCAVGNQFLACSTLELGHEMVDLLEKEQKEGPAASSAATSRAQVYSQGGAELLQSIEDILLTQAILDQALPPAEAREQVKAFITLVRHLGVVDLQVEYGPKLSHFDIRLLLNP